MAQLRQDYRQFKILDTEIVVFGPEKADSFMNYWKKNDLEFSR